MKKKHGVYRFFVCRNVHGNGNEQGKYDAGNIF